MSSDLVPVLQLLQNNDYATVVLVAAVVYDYILMFTREVNYIWCRPWSWVSTVFVFVRYLGIFWALTIGLAGSTFVPGPDNVVKYFEGAAIFISSNWFFSVFVAASELVMIFRVYAMWSRSKRILAVLLVLYAAEVIADFTVVGIYVNPETYFSAMAVRVQNVSFCSYSVNTTTRFKVYYGIPRFVLSAALLVLALIETSSQSVTMYRATKLWQPNRYIKLFMSDGILYFFLNTLFNVFGEVANDPTLTSSSGVYLAALTDLLLCPIVPRFIISTREMYDHELRHGVQGLIDTGFGIGSQSSVSRDAASTIAFAGGTTEEGIAVEADVDDQTPLEVVGNSTCQA